MKVIATISAPSPEKAVEWTEMAIENGADMASIRLDTLASHYSPRDSDVWKRVLQEITGTVGKMSIASVVTGWQGGFFYGTDEERTALLIDAMRYGFMGVEVDVELPVPLIRKIAGEARRLGKTVFYSFRPLMAELPPENIIKVAEDAAALGHTKKDPGQSERKNTGGFFYGAPVKTRRDLDSLMAFLAAAEKWDVPCGLLPMGDYGFIASFLSTLGQREYIFTSQTPGGGEISGSTPFRTETYLKLSPFLAEQTGMWLTVKDDFSKTKITGEIAHTREKFVLSRLLISTYRAISEDGLAHFVHLPLPWDTKDPGTFFDMMVDLEFIGGFVGNSLQRAAVEAVDDLETEAENVGAVDTLFVDGDTLVGDNTRHRAYMDLVREIPLGWEEKTVLIVGSGGEVNSAIAGLLETACEVKVAVPDEKEADRIRDVFGKTPLFVEWKKRQRAAENSDVIVITPMKKRWDEIAVDLLSLTEKQVLINVRDDPDVFEVEKPRSGLITFTLEHLFPHQALHALSLWGMDIDEQSVYHLFIKGRENADKRQTEKKAGGSGE